MYHPSKISANVFLQLKYEYEEEDLRGCQIGSGDNESQIYTLTYWNSSKNAIFDDMEITILIRYED